MPALTGDRPGRLWSLWDMLTVNAADYIKAGEAFATIKPILDPPTDGWFEQNAILQFDQTRFVFENLAELEGHCAVLRLDVTAGMLKQFLERFDGSGVNVSQKDAHIAMVGIANSFKVELANKLFLYVLPHRAPYYAGDGCSPEEHRGAETDGLLAVLEDFPNAQYDAREAGYCFAFERFTATVYHLMRVAEYGLVAVAMAAEVESDEHRSWDKLIAGIHRYINRLSSQKKSPNWKDEEKKFSDLCAWFTAIRNGWRNPVSHIPRVYQEDVARGMFASTRTLFERLKREGFKEIQMQAIPTLAPPEDPGDDV